MADGCREQRGRAIANGAAARLVPALALLSAACGIYRVPRVEPLGPVPIRQAILEARNGNWQVRITTPDTTLEGRAAFVSDTSVRIGGTPVGFGAIRRLDRRSRADLGGRPAGAFVGAAVGAFLGSAHRGWWQSGVERQCAGGCTLGIFVPWIAGSTLLGTMVGSAVHPPRERWVRIWTRP